MRKVIVICFLICILNFVIANPVVTTSNLDGFYEVDVNSIFLANISINNTDMGMITNVTINIPSSLIFIKDSFGTSTTSTSFENTSSSLKWNGNLIDLNSIEYFWFKANASDIGSFSISVLMENSSSPPSISDLINIDILPVEGCTPKWNCSEWGECKNGIQVRDCFEDLNDCGVDPMQKDVLKLCKNCEQNWTCTDWSECQDGFQIRSCVDQNACGNESGRPLESQSCGLGTGCVPEWSCSDWEPSVCLSNGLQTRTCIDDNNCGIEAPETRACDYVPKFVWLFWVLFFIILMLIGFVIFLMIKKFKELKGLNQIPSQPL